MRRGEAVARDRPLPGTRPRFLDETVADGNSVLRLLHYPPMGPDGPSIRAGAHEDINTITLLLGAEEAGWSCSIATATGCPCSRAAASWR